MASIFDMNALSCFQKEELIKAGNVAISMVTDLYKQGERPSLGDKFVFEFEDCILIVNFDGVRFQGSYISGKPIKINFSTGIFDENGYVKEDKED